MQKFVKLSIFLQKDVYVSVISMFNKNNKIKVHLNNCFLMEELWKTTINMTFRLRFRIKKHS